MSELLLEEEPSEAQFSPSTFLDRSLGTTSTMKCPPPVSYLPSFDYSLNGDFDPPETKGSPFNYPMTPSKNRTFYNPFMSRTNKRVLNISSSSVGSSCSFYAPISKRLKFLKHDTSICSENCDTSMDRSQCSLNNTTQLKLETDFDPEEEKVGDLANNNQEEVCSSCQDLSPSVAECLSCPERTSLCQLCLEAHRRVRLTREHDIKILNHQVDDRVELTLLRTFQCMVDLVKMTRSFKCMDLDSAIDSCIAEALNFRIENQDFKLNENEDKMLQQLLSIELLPLFNENSKDISVKVMKVVQAVFELELIVSDPAILVTDSCLQAYLQLLSLPATESDIIILTLDCLSTVTTLLGAKQMKYQLKILQDQLKSILSLLKDAEGEFVINVKFKASKLSRQIMKALV